MSGSRWITIERGKCSGQVVPEAEAREKLQSVVTVQSRSEAHTILCNSETEPVYCHDSTAFQWVVEKGDGHFQETKESALMRPNYTADPKNSEIWSQEKLFSLEFTRDFEGRGFGRKSVEALRKQNLGEKMYWFFVRFAKGKLSIPEYVLLSSIFASVFVLSYLGSFMFFESQPDTLNAEKLRARIENGPSDGVRLRAQKLIKPESLRLLDDLIRSKLRRDNELYAKTLIRLEKVRSQFPPEYLPPRAFVAAVALHLLPSSEQERQKEWSQLLQALGKSNSSALPALAYEEAKSRQRLLGLQQRIKGEVAGAGKSSFATWTLAEQLTGRKHNRELQEKAQKAYEESSKSLTRAMRLSDLSSDSYLPIKRYLLARLVTQFLNMTWYLNSKSQKSFLMSVLNSLQKDAENLELADRSLILYLIQERRRDLTEPGKASALDSWKARWDLLQKWQTESAGLCQIAQSGIAPSFVTETLGWGQDLSVAFPALSFPKWGVWEKCFLGADPYDDLQSVSLAEGQVEDPFSYFPRNSSVWTSYRLTPLSDIHLKHKGFAETWALMALNQISPFRSSLAALQKHLCVANSPPQLCKQIAFWLLTDPKQRMEILQKMQEDIGFKALADLSFEVASDTLLSTEFAARRNLALQNFEKFGFGQYFGESYPEFPVLEWHLRNLP